MGVGDLAKHGNRATATSQEADDFINGARTDGKKAVKPKPIKERVYKRLTFSLSQDIDDDIERLSLVPRDFRATRSDVIRAAVALLASRPEDEIADLMRDASNK
jgi:hypothetical protein